MPATVRAQVHPDALVFWCTLLLCAVVALV